jgi:hypothetical protein
VVLRIVLAAVAAAAVAWFAVLLVDVHRVNQAAASNGSIVAVAAALRGPQAEFERRIDRLRQARFLNPDSAADLDIAGAYQVRGGAANLATGLRIARSVARREPQNLDAWLTIFRIQLARHDPAGERLALAVAHRLDPRDFKGS